MTAQKNRWIRKAAILVCVSMTAVAAPNLAAAPANAATQTITITSAGFVPMNLTIKTGDTVTFTNADAAAHEVLFRATAGFTCTAAPLVVQPTKSQACTWTLAGRYAFSDPNQKDRTFQGTVTVDPVVVASVSLAASSPSVKYGTDATLTGKVIPSAAGTVVDILAMAAGDTVYAKVASVVTTNGGAYSLAVNPEIRTGYRAEFSDGAVRVVSAVTAVEVRPQVRLVLRYVRGVRAYLRTSVISSLSYAGKFALVQRRNAIGGWTTVKRVELGASSTARFAVRLPSGTSRIRMLLTASQAGAGYLSSASRTLLVTR